MTAVLTPSAFIGNAPGALPRRPGIQTPRVGDARAPAFTGVTGMMEFPPFRLDLVNQCLWRCGEAGHAERIHLTPKAFAVLQHLVKHAGRLVTQDELLDAVWPKCCVQPEVLKSQILDLRRVIGDDPKNPRFIETLARRGYQFIAAVHELRHRLTLIPDTDERKLVGRRAALIRLREILQTATDGRRQLVFVSGATGIGKTALVDAFQHHVMTAAPAVRIARGQCVEGYAGTEAFYPMLEALGQLCRGPAGPSLVQILTTRAPTWLVQFPELLSREHRETLRGELLGTTRERMLREIGEFLEAIATETPLLLLFEDLHRADHSTVDLLSMIARRRYPAKLMLVGTYHPADIGAADRPLRALTCELLLHRLCQEIALAPLRETEVAEYLSAVPGASGEIRELAGLIYRYTEGNPLFMVTVLEHLRDRQLISSQGGDWTLRVPLRDIELRAPESLRQMVEVQIGRLSEEERRMLEAASVAGPTFSTVVGAGAANMEPERFEETCEELARADQVVRSVDPTRFPDGTVSARYEFVHSVYHEVLYTHQLACRRTKLHRRAAMIIETLYAQAPEDAAPELAHHCECAGDWLAAIKYLQLAADTFARRFGPRQAAEILEHALDLVSKLPAVQRAELEAGILERSAAICNASLDSRAIDPPGATAGMTQPSVRRGAGCVRFNLHPHEAHREGTTK
jgi:DNA-binding winged helix-turn-helix (wHTH) protein